MKPQKALQAIKDKKKHKFYEQAVEYAVDIAIHADDHPPGKLITERRPKESKVIADYREAIRIAKTEAPVFKVMNSLMKIRKSQDWMIKYNESDTKIAEDETLERYMEYNFPRYASFTNWFFSVCFKQYLIDANAVSFVMPENLLYTDGKYNIEQNEYLKPYPVIYNSNQILDYSRSHYLLHSAEKNNFTEKGRNYEGEIYYLVDNKYIYEWKEINAKGDLQQSEYIHGLGVLPIVKLGGVVKKELKEICLYKSRISPMVPELKEALREYSDLQAEVVQHIHSTLWSIAAQACSKCGGAGKVIGGKDKPAIECKACKGRGTYPFNPFENFEIRQPKAGEPAAPTPPAGFINKQIDIAKLQDQRVQDHIYYAYCALNFEFLAKSPTNQSGYAKDVDKSELNNFVHSVAEDIVRIYDDHYKIINEYRNAIIVPNKTARGKLIPFIPVPQKYDILSEQYVLDEIAKLKTANIDTSILNATLIDYANKKFGNDQNTRDYIINCIELDPFASENEDALILKLQNNGISKLKYTIHCNIKHFVKDAFSDDEDFYAMPYDERYEVIEKMAEDMIEENSASGKIIQMINDTTGNDNEAAAAN